MLCKSVLLVMKMMGVKVFSLCSLIFFAGLVTIHIRHFHIHENEVGLFPVIDFDGLKSVAGSDRVVVLFQNGVDEDNNGSRIIHDENFRPTLRLGVHGEASGFSKDFDQGKRTI